MPPPRPSLLRRCGSAALLAAALGLTGCGDDGEADADARADQVQAAAEEAGLSTEVAEVLALAARGSSATFQVTYPGPDGTELVVSQDPPDRRLDALQAGLVVESQVSTDGVSYRCTVPAGGRPGDALECRRSSGAQASTGAFTERALDDFTEQLADSRDLVDLTVEERTIAGATATCLVASPKPATVADGSDPVVDTLCLAADGAQLLLDVGGERLVAETYTDRVPEGTFEV